MKVNAIDERLPKASGCSYRLRNLAKVTAVVVHHSATRAIGLESGWEDVIHGIAKYHIVHLGWPGIGYHYVIDPDGGVWKTNPVSSLSYHAAGGNTSGIGVMLLGNFDDADPTVEQMASLKELVREIHANMPQVARVIGHRDVPGARTACPGANFTASMLAHLTSLVADGS